jgi:hypothetical protein
MLLHRNKPFHVVVTRPALLLAYLPQGPLLQLLPAQDLILFSLFLIVYLCNCLPTQGPLLQLLPAQDLL